MMKLSVNYYDIIYSPFKLFKSSMAYIINERAYGVWSLYNQ